MLNKKQVILVRQSRKAGATYKEIAEAVGLSEPSVIDVALGRSYKKYDEFESPAEKMPNSNKARGERHGNAKLSLEDVQDIRGRDKSVPSRELAEEFGVSTSAIAGIRNGKNWIFDA